MTRLTGPDLQKEPAYHGPVTLLIKSVQSLLSLAKLLKQSRRFRSTSERAASELRAYMTSFASFMLAPYSLLVLYVIILLKVIFNDAKEQLLEAMPNCSLERVLQSAQDYWDVFEATGLDKDLAARSVRLDVSS